MPKRSWPAACGWRVWAPHWRLRKQRKPEAHANLGDGLCAGHCYASTIINGRNRMGNDTGHGARFSVSQVNDGLWVVVDDAKAKRLIASCRNRDAELMIAALMNGNAPPADSKRNELRWHRRYILDGRAEAGWPPPLAGA